MQKIILRIGTTIKEFKNQAEREAFLKEVGDAHRDWSIRHEADEDVFDLNDSDRHDKTNPNTDYPIFYLDRTAPKATEDEFFDEVEKL